MQPPGGFGGRPSRVPGVTTSTPPRAPPDFRSIATVHGENRAAENTVNLNQVLQRSRQSCSAAFAEAPRLHDDPHLSGFTLPLRRRVSRPASYPSAATGASISSYPTRDNVATSRSDPRRFGGTRAALLTIYAIVSYGTTTAFSALRTGFRAIRLYLRLPFCSCRSPST
jgi:hypothetical protein